MGTSLDFKLEVEARKVREMCSVLSKSEMTDLIVELYRLDTLKNDYIRTITLGDLHGSNVSRLQHTITDQEAIAMKSWLELTQPVKDY